MGSLPDESLMALSRVQHIHLIFKAGIHHPAVAMVKIPVPYAENHLHAISYLLCIFTPVETAISIAPTVVMDFFQSQLTLAFIID